MFYFEIFQIDELLKQRFKNFDKLIHINFIKIVKREYFREKSI